ncbi:hypothetical protein [Streptococcus hyointestinalis]|nr:hypothetical protein [Streptococcus hyointestinalis]
MSNASKLNKLIFKIIRFTLIVSMLMVFGMDLLIEHKVNLHYLAWCCFILYLIADDKEP